MQVHKLLDDVQPQAAAAGPRVIAALGEAVEDMRLHGIGHAGAGVLHADQHPPSGHALHLAGNPPTGGGELEGVGQQIGHHPHELGPIHLRIQFVLSPQTQADVAVLRRGLEARRDLPHQGHQIGVHVGHGHAVGVDAGQIEQVVHLLQQAAGIALDGGQAEALTLAQGRAVLDELIHRPEDEGQRRAQLVAHIGEKAGLVAVQLLQPLQGALQLAVLARQLGAAGDLLGDVAPLRQQEGHLALVVEDGGQGEIDDDGAAALAVSYTHLAHDIA